MQSSDYRSSIDDNIDKFYFYNIMSNFKIVVTKIFKGKIILIMFYNMPFIFVLQKLNL